MGSFGRFFPSWTEEQALRERELAASLTDTIEMLPYVVSAKVHISLPTTVRLASQYSPSSASVVILSDYPDSVSKDEVRSIIAGAVSRLEKANVGVFVHKTKSPTSMLSKCASKTGETFLSKWKPYIVALILLVMLSAIALIVTGVRRIILRAR
ncbi:MAG: hypothetical protein JXX14_05075 [Deltaproteobacteria bacterium]|nr:hypothetical protein [Deltaproteobacteria bacterium]